MSGAWIVQKMRKVPFDLKVCEKVPFLLVAEPNLSFASDTLWRRLPFQVQTTFVPFLIVMGLGVKKSSLTETCFGLGVVAAPDGSATTPAATAATGSTSFLI